MIIFAYLNLYYLLLIENIYQKNTLRLIILKKLSSIQMHIISLKGIIRNYVYVFINI